MNPVIIEFYETFEDELQSRPAWTSLAPPSYNFDEINAYSRGICEALGYNHFILFFS